MAVNTVLLSMSPVSVPSLSVLTTAPAAHPSATPCSPCRAITIPIPHTSCIPSYCPRTCPTSQCPKFKGHSTTGDENGGGEGVPLTARNRSGSSL